MTDVDDFDWLEPDIVTQSQFFNGRHKVERGERMLWLCVLDEAWNNYHAIRRPTDQRWRVEQWLKSPDLYPGSFLWICETFDVEPERLRAAICLRKPHRKCKSLYTRVTAGDHADTA